jgi:hypothetical protein
MTLKRLLWLQCQLGLLLWCELDYALLNVETLLC